MNACAVYSMHALWANQTNYTWPTVGQPNELYMAYVDCRILTIAIIARMEILFNSNTPIYSYHVMRLIIMMPNQKKIQTELSSLTDVFCGRTGRKKTYVPFVPIRLIFALNILFCAVLNDS